MDRLISYAEALEYFGVPPHAQAGFVAVGAKGVSEKTIRRVLSGETYPRAATAAHIRRAVMQAHSRLMGLADVPFAESQVKEIRASEQYAWIACYEGALAEFIEQERHRRIPISDSSGELNSTQRQLLERIRMTLYVMAGFEVASSRQETGITPYWAHLLPGAEEGVPGRIRMPLWRWFDQLRTQFEKGSLFVGVRATEQKAAISLFDLCRHLAVFPQHPDLLTESERKKVAVQFQPPSEKRIHHRKLPYAAVEKELGLAPKQASRWANASRATDLPGWKALLLINQRMLKLMPPLLLKNGPNLPIEFLVARFLHAFCLDCLARGATQSMLQSMEPWYSEAAEVWIRYFNGAGKAEGQNPLLAASPPPP